MHPVWMYDNNYTPLDVILLSNPLNGELYIEPVTEISMIGMCLRASEARELLIYMLHYKLGMLTIIFDLLMLTVIYK